MYNTMKLRSLWRVITSKMSEMKFSSDLSVADNTNNEKSDPWLVKEGSAEIKIPNGKSVFYNPVQEFNRDLSISVLQVASNRHVIKQQSGVEKNHAFRILEALSASGLRSIRFAKEIPNVTEIIANDLSNTALEVIEKNIKHNNVENIVHSSNMDAVELMFQNRHPDKRFQVVDLDPYGCPSQFLDSAVQCVVDGGYLLVTCTDMAVLCGNSPETCFLKYGSISLKSKACHEMALRIALHAIQSHAGKYKRYIVPVVSLSVDYYIRIIVRIYTSALKCKEVTSKLAMVYQCCGCGSLSLQPLGILKMRGNSEKSCPPAYNLSSAPAVNKLCEHCNGKHQMGGPIWSAPLHDLDFVHEVICVVQNSNLSTKSRLLGILNMVLEELQDVPLYYDLSELSSIAKLKRTPPMITVRSALMNHGYQVSYSHTCKNSLKTNAPMKFIWDVLRELNKEYPRNGKHIAEGTTAYNILSKTSESKIDFSLRPDANPHSRKNNLLRFQMNPMPYWGPGRKCAFDHTKSEKKIQKQNKKRKAEVMEDDNTK